MKRKPWIEQWLDEGVTPTQLVSRLLDGEAQSPTSLREASAHRPRRGKIWVAYYTGLEPGQQVSRTTGLTDYPAALAQAREWEAQVKAQRAARGQKRTPTLRVRRPAANTASGPLTQREIALLLGMSERGVRNVEKRALRKLAKLPFLSQFWSQYLKGELPEGLEDLTPEEKSALLGLARTPNELFVMRKVLGLLEG
jgi:hypothetical protein